MKIAVVSAHPDDETLGCGGTLLKHRDNGDSTYWIILTGIPNDSANEKARARRLLEIERVAKKYRFTKVFQLNYTPTALHTVDFAELVRRLSAIFLDLKPTVLYCTNRSDVHSDHQVATKAVFSSSKSFRFPFIKRVLMYECLSETEAAPALPESAFLPNAYSDITPYIGKKWDIMKIYASEIGHEPFPRSKKVIEALARVRGAAIGVEFAEAFMITRDVF